MSDDTLPRWSRPPASTRVLIVEDHADSRELLALMLQRQGFEVLAVGDGRQAVDALEDEEFDLALIDIDLPGLSGLDVARLGSRVGHRGTLMVAVTGRDTEADRERSRAAGFDEHLAKPLRGQELFRCMQRLLEQADAERDTEPG